MSDPGVALAMLGILVFAIMIGFPVAFTLMALGVGFGYYAYFQAGTAFFDNRVFYLLTTNTFTVLNNDALVSIPLFLMMGYLVERANILDGLFKSLRIALKGVPASLAVATLATCALFATATGIVGAVVTLMGLLALPAMLRSGYDVRLSAGVITAGGCLGILIPPSVLLILYGATAGVSVVQLYAGAFFPGLMLTALYIGYVVILAKLRPGLAPMPPESERRVVLSDTSKVLAGGQHRRAIPRLLAALARPPPGVSRRQVLGQVGIALLPALLLAAVLGTSWMGLTASRLVDTGGLQEVGETGGGSATEYQGVQEPPSDEAAPGVAEPPGAEPTPRPAEAAATPAPAPPPAVGERTPAPPAYWIAAAVALLLLAVLYAFFTFERLEILKMLLTSFFPLTMLILSVLGSIVFGWATPTEAAALGAAGAMLLTAAYRRFTWSVLKDSVFLTAKTTAMVCWLFVGSSIFSAAFALLGGQGLIERWVLGLDLTPVQFMLLAQSIIFLLGWPLEWTEIIVIFMPIFIPLLGHFDIDPLFFGLLVALNLQTAFLSPPVAMAAFYLKGVAPPHVTLNQIFAGMMPFMAIQVLAVFLLYLFPAIGLWLPGVLYR